MLSILLACFQKEGNLINCVFLSPTETIKMEYFKIF